MAEIAYDRSLAVGKRGAKPRLFEMDAKRRRRF